MRYVLIILSWAMCIGGLHADEAVKVRAAALPQKASVGSTIEYRVTAAGPKVTEAEIVFPESREFYPPLEKKDKKSESGEDDSARHVPLYIIHSAVKEDSSEAGTGYISAVMKLSFYRPGRHTLPEIEISVSGKKINYELPSVEIEPVNQEGQMAEIEPPLDLGGNHTRLMLLLLAAVLLTLAAVLAWRYIKKRRAQKEALVPPVPAIEVFRKEAGELGAQELINSGRIEDYTVEISRIFRRYISSLFAIDAAEMTSDEIAAVLRRLGKKAGIVKQIEAMMSCFNLWDLSKFAEFMPGPEVLLESNERIARVAEELWEALNVRS